MCSAALRAAHVPKHTLVQMLMPCVCVCVSPVTDLDSAMEEAREVLVGAMEGLLHKTGMCC